MTYYTSFIATFLFLAVAVNAQDGAALYNKNCKACHTIGEGIKVGPDLAGITSKRDFDWLVKFVKSSNDLIASGDVDAIAIFEEFDKKPMPNHSHSVAEIQSMFDYVASGGASADGTDTDASNESLVFVPDPEKGLQLFTGELSLANGGPSCISCHNIRHDDVFFGGQMALDLSTSHTEGVVESMEISMPSMINSYANSPLTVMERAHLELFLKSTKKDQLYHRPGQFNGMFFLLGALFFIVILVIINVFWKNNKIAGVRDEIFKRQIRSK